MAVQMQAPLAAEVPVPAPQPSPPVVGSVAPNPAPEPAFQAAPAVEPEAPPPFHDPTPDPEPPRFNYDPPVEETPRFDHIGQGREGEDEAFNYEPPFKPRKNPTRRWTLAALAAGVLMVAGIGVMQLIGTPNLFAKLGIPGLQVDIPLEFDTTNSLKPQRRTLPSGKELFSVSGQVVNPTSEQQPVPNIIIELLNPQGIVVHTLTIPPPLRTIAPKAKMDFSGADFDVPKGASDMRLSFSGA